MLTVVGTGQQHFAEIIRDYLKRITYGDDGWAERLRLPAYAKAEVTVDPRQAFGQPLVVHGGARVEAPIWPSGSSPTLRASFMSPRSPAHTSMVSTLTRRASATLAAARGLACQPA